MTAATLDHERANFALEEVQKIANKDYAKKFRGYAESLPAVIVRNGLGQALAMEASNGKIGQNQTSEDEKAHYDLYKLVSNWLMKKIYKKGGEIRALQTIEQIINSSQDQYMRAQEEAIHLLQWVKRFANAMIERDTNG